MNALQKLAAKKKLTYMLKKVAQVAGMTSPNAPMSVSAPPPAPPVNQSLPARKPMRMSGKMTAVPTPRKKESWPNSTSTMTATPTKPIVLKGDPAQKERFRKNTLNTLATGQSSAMKALRTSGSTPPPRTGQPSPPVAGRRY